VTVGRRYAITAASGQWELIEVVGKNGTTLATRHPMLGDYPIGSTVAATRATVTLDTSWLTATGNLSSSYSPNPRYRVRWLVTVGGESRVYDRYFDLIRYPARHGVTPGDIDERFPGWLDALPVDRQVDQGRTLIDRAFHQVRMDLYQDGKADTAIRNSEAVAELVIARTMLLKLEDEAMRGGVDARALDLAAAVYRQRYDGMIRSPFLATDTSGGGGASPANNVRTPVWRR